MEIPKCEKEEHCWHPQAGGGASAASSQRCCHCGLDLAFERAPFEAGQEHGYHGKNRAMQDYRLIADTTYQDMYKEDPGFFHRVDKALEKGRKAAAAARKRFQGMRIFPRNLRFK